MKKNNRILPYLGVYKMLAICLFLLCSLSAYAQNQTIKGVVHDSMNEPLIGVAVTVKGTTNGTLTNLDGQFEIQAPTTATLEFSYIGYTKQDVVLAGKTSINVVMVEDVVLLKDVVAIGYATGSQKTISGAVQKISKEDMNVGVIVNPLDAIQGKIAGVNIQSVNSDPTTTPSVRIRGTTSLSGGNDPLVVIDGVMGDMDMLNALSPNDIDSYTILKDASETAQYGSRGASGVIVVTTQRGKYGAKSLSYNGTFGVQTAAKRVHMLSADAFRQAANDRGLSFVDEGANSDFMDEMIRTGLTQTHNVSFGNGNEDSNYNVSLGFIDQKGLIETTNKQRFTQKIDVSQYFFDRKLKLESGYFGSKINQRNINDFRKTFYGAAAMNPTFPTTPNADGTWPRDPNANEIDNPLDRLTLQDRNKINRAIVYGRATWTIIDGLKMGAFGSYTHSDTDNSVYFPTTSRAGQNAGGGLGARQDYKKDNKLGNVSLNYVKEFGKHRIDALGLVEGQTYKNTGFRAITRSYTSDYSGSDNLAGGAVINPGDVQSYKNEYKLYSYLGRFNYVYDNKYIGTINMRADGSSKLGANEKWGYFPSLSAAWIVTEESFMKDTKKIMNELKIRGSYGITGNQDAIDPYTSLQLMGISLGTDVFNPTAPLITVDGKPAVYYTYNRNANPDLKWETKKTFDIGFDAAFLNDKITFTFDYYNSTTKDLLYTYNVPVPPFIQNTLLANIGTMKNEGYEFAASYKPIDTKDIGLDVSANFSYQKNKVTSLSGNYRGQTLTPSAYISLSSVSGAGQVGGANNVVYMMEGQPLGVFYLPKADGLKNDGTGKNKYNIQDIDGVDGVNVNDGYDRYIAGQATPKYYVGGNIKFRYKAFDIQTQLNGAFGHKIYNGTALTFNNMNTFPTYNLLNSAPGLNIYDNTVSDYWLESGNYLNIAYITLGYTVNTAQFNKWVKSLKVTASVNNVHTFTSYSGLSPMINSSNLDSVNNTFGVDDKRFYPVARTYSIGLSVNF